MKTLNKYNQKFTNIIINIAQTVSVVNISENHRLSLITVVIIDLVQQKRQERSFYSSPRSAVKTERNSQYILCKNQRFKFYLAIFLPQI